MKSLQKTYLSILIQAFAIASVPVTTLYAQPAQAQVTEQRSYNIPANTLGYVLSTFAAQSGVVFSYDPKIVQGQTSPGLQGKYSVDTGFKKILAETSYQLKESDQGYVLIKNNENKSDRSDHTQINNIHGATVQQEAVQLAPLVVYGQKDRDTQGYDDVYDKNYSTVYAGKDLIERFKGTTPSDLFKGMANVYSGDARNSGALDPNIRGVQG
ncbi:STN domain-containing protein, partial [Acinetobacter qingfengensis]